MSAATPKTAKKTTKKTSPPKEAPVVEAPAVVEAAPAPEPAPEVSSSDDSAQAGGSSTDKPKRQFVVVEARLDGPDGKVLEVDTTKRFTGTSPSGAARKAAYKIFSGLPDAKEAKSLTAMVSVRETPRGRMKKEAFEEALSKAKVYSYVLTRTRVEDREPAKFGLGDDGSPKTTVLFPYMMSVRAVRAEKAE